LALATVFFAFQIYGDFSAYSDIAIGTARLFGVKLMRNFAYPYFSQSVSEFWRRWHISLSSWFRDYLFLPLGGSRVSRPRLVFNIMATFVVSGLWHGAAWTYVVWGALNGLGILPAALWSKERITSNMIPGGAGFFPRPGTALRLLSTFAFICVTWVFFRARSFGDVYLIWSKVFTWPILPQQSLEFTPAFVSTGGMIWLVSVFVVVEWLSRHRLHPLEWGRLPRIARWSGYTALIWLTLYLRTWQSGTFIYFRF
jgi:alginate O-acetyltransferase complex protein AlgI